MTIPLPKLAGPAKCSSCATVSPRLYDGFCPLCAIRTAREETEEVRSELSTRMGLAGDVHDGLKRQVERLVQENKQLRQDNQARLLAIKDKA